MHRLPLEEGLPALPGLNHGPSWRPGDTGRWVPSPPKKPKSYRVDTRGVWALLAKVEYSKHFTLPHGNVLVFLKK